MVQIGRLGEQTSLTQTNHRQVVAGGPPLGDLSYFFGKKSYFNAIWIKFCTVLELFEITKFLRLENHLKESSW